MPGQHRGAAAVSARPVRRRPLWVAGAAAAILLAAAAGLWMAGGLIAPWAGTGGPAAAAGCPPVAAGMAWVPPGTVTLGDSVYPEEGPPRTVSLEGFWIDRTEVTNDQFAEFVRATGYVTQAERPADPARHAGLPPELRVPGAVVFAPPPQMPLRMDAAAWWRWVPGANWRTPDGPGSGTQGRGRWPVVAVTLADAQAYARWKGHALPTEAQWEWAARGAGVPALAPAATAASNAPGPAAPPPDPRRAPAQANTWQGLFPVLDSGDDGFKGLAPVGCFAPNALGLHDMIGNVWELTADAWQDATPAGPASGVDTGTARATIKGGSYLCAPNWCMRYRPGARQPQEADLAAGHVGFRTIRSSPPGRSAAAQ